MARKIALLIGVGEFGTGLTPLHCPENGVAAMRTILNDPELGAFDQVITLINPDVGEMRSRICEVFAQLTKQDLVLFYFTGHGIKDMTGDFYLTTAQTQLFANGRPNAGTAVGAGFLRREIGNALAARKVIILDCCFGAAFADGFLTMNDGSIDLEAQLGGKGWCVMTSSTSARYALEKEGEDLSVYTRYLVEGIKTGGAAPDGQDVISAVNLHEYVVAQVKVAAPAMEPAIFNGQQGYNIVIAKAQVDNAQRYRKQVQKKLTQGTIGPAGMAVLGQWQQRLGLSPQEAKAIEDEILQPYRERQRHLALYTQALEAEKGYAYPLNAGAVQNLRELQTLLRLRREDVQRIERQILGKVPLDVGPMSHPQAARSHDFEQSPSFSECNIHLEYPVPETIPERVIERVPRPLSQRELNPTSGPASRPVSGDLPSQQSLSPQPFSPTVSTYQFETVRVNRKGELTKWIQREATTFVEPLGNDVALRMVHIPGGRFLMGAPLGEEGASEGESPQREVTVPDFWMGTTTISRAQWNAFLSQQQGPLAARTDRTDRANSVDRKALNRPIENIFWTDAVEYCQWLSQRTGRDYQLPSDAQWEYACRAGTTTPFSFGETITSALVNYNGNYAYGQGPRGGYRQQTTDVGSFPSNAFGLYDMHGNVWEWCLDGWHGFPKGVSTAEMVQRLSGQQKVLRGGSWSYLPTNCRSAYRLTYPFHNRMDDIGFRVVCMDPKL
ncbi:MAG: SUMF1/EgtB/PvdO family nonheme iron enzyme [Cyanobacteria bacterium P01_F01_bin.53]